MSQKNNLDAKLDRSVEEETRKFYDNVGWVADEKGVVGEDKLFRHYGVERRAYGARIDAQPAHLLKNITGTVLFAGPGDLPKSHTLAAEKFNKVICVDISQQSLKICEQKLGSKGRYECASLMNIPLDDNSVDAVLCTHVLYHIDKNNQEQVIEELIRVTKPGGRIVVVYSNPNSPYMIIQRFLKFLKINKLLGKEKLYTHYFSISWWDRFASVNTVKVLPNNAISANQARVLLPFSFMRRGFYQWAQNLESSSPDIAARLWPYITITIDPKA